jgi:hypothetical protein
MDAFKDFVEKTLTDEFKELTTGSKVREERTLSPEEKDILIKAYQLTTSVANLGIKAINTFKVMVPLELQKDIKSVIGKVAEDRSKYRSGQIDAATLKATIKECRDKASEIRKKLKSE